MFETTKFILEVIFIYQYNNKQLVNRELLKAGQYVYYYDGKNNLISYLTPTYMIDYFYDNRNRLIGDGEPGSEIEYTYDDRDNITSIYYRETNKTRTFTYDTLDRLVSYDGKQVVYNNQNQHLYPTIIQTNNGRIELTWIHNKLVEYKKYVGNTVSEYLTFTYNHLGLRTQKINRKLNNKTTNYVYDVNNRLIYERTNNEIIKYYYDMLIHWN